ncbi:GumC family protein [Aquiflexum lacus]|uniref:GumC family protein n=1 Tax=Aquiflexum lacus TaxID=2483805 RepID=UPI001E47E5DB|nr:polysaccharide biosynthesis tyrosine autokinase [Aquiflexum lacus]
MEITPNNMDFNPQEKETQFDPIKFLFKYFKFWPYILVSIIIFVGIAFFVNKTTPPFYQVSAKFFIKEDENNNGILNLTGLTKSISGKSDQWVVNQAIFLKSRPVAERALSRLDLNVDYFEPGLFTDTELYKSAPIHVQVDWEHSQILEGKIKISWENDSTYSVSFPEKNYMHYVPGSSYEEIEMDGDTTYKGNFKDFSQLPWLKIKVTLIKNIPVGESLILLRPKGSLLSEYTGDNFQVFPTENNSTVLGLALNTSHPQKGADYLNTLMEVFLDMELEEKNRMSRRTVDFIDSQIAGVYDTLSYFEDNLQAFRSSNRTYDVAAESNTVFQQITSLEAELSKERFNKDYFEELKNYLQRGNFEQIIAPAGLGISDPTLNDLISNLISLQSDRSNLLVSQTEASPRVRELSRKIQDTSSSILEYLKNLSNNAQMRINDFETRINSIERQFSQLPSTEQSLVRIERGRNLNESIYNYLQQRRAEAAITMASSFSSNKIVEYARSGATPIKVKQTVVYVIFFALGFILPVAIITVIVLTDNRIKDPKELEEVLSMPLIAKIPQSKLDNALVVINEPRSAIAESFRALKTNISFVVPLERQLTIAVSSTLSGEGKTFTAINLASIYSMNNKKTILISCDMFKPYSFKDFKLEKKVGLSNYLSQQVNSAFDIIQSSKFASFDVVLAGAVPPNPSDLLASQRFVVLLEELKKMYDVIILDTPPVGLISQSLEVIKHVDLIAYVLRYNFSENSFIEELNAMKKKRGIHNVYAILNDVPAKELTYKGFDYGYYEESKKKKKFGFLGRDKAAM